MQKQDSKNTLPIMSILNRCELISQRFDISQGRIFGIVIGDIGENFPPLFPSPFESVVFIKFNDVESGEYGCITSEQAQLIIDFISAIKFEQNDRLIVSCTGGVCRSPAVAASLMLYFGLDDINIWGNGKYSPNVTVYKTIAERLHLDTNKLNLKKKQELNLRRWKQYHDI